MLKIRLMVLNLGLLISLLGLASPAFAHSGHTVWGPWRFDWEVKDSAGIAIRNVYYNNELLLYKASVPVIRVQYDEDRCGPYADRITWDNLADISNCGNQKVCQRSFTSPDGRNWLELGVLAMIGSYRLYQVWYLSHDGWIFPTLWSKGLQCPVDHNHHTYWRVDFDLNGAPCDQTFVYDDNRPNEGWGLGWHKYTNELNDVKNPPTARVWFGRDHHSGHGLWVFPEPDGVADGFSTLDLGTRLYHASEEGPWPFGAWGEVGYENDVEDIQEKDNVVWYIGHLHHRAAEGGGQWHWVGPSLLVAR